MPNPPIQPSGQYLATQLAPRRELLAWAMYDFANSGYTTVVLTTLFNAYFVGVVATQAGLTGGTGTLLWTLAIGVSNVMVLVTAPIVGAIADYRAHKKAFLAAATFGCVVFTASLAFTGPGDVVAAMVLLILSNFMFATGENLIAAFLPELAPARDMGRVSGYAWSLGYVGGLLTLGACLAYVMWAASHQHSEAQYVPVTMLIVAAFFGLAALVTLTGLRERAFPVAAVAHPAYVRTAFRRLRETLAQRRRYTDLFRFMLTLTVFHCGLYTVVVLAAVYARQVMGFDPQQTIVMIVIVNVTASVGAFLFGHVQDRFGSTRTLTATLLLWVIAILLVVSSDTLSTFWLAANIIGLALGSSQSAGRTLIGLFSPPGRFAEFFGFWGLSLKVAAVIGPITYGLITFLTQDNHRIALLSTLCFFVVGLLLLQRVDEHRGRRAALQDYRPASGADSVQ